MLLLGKDRAKNRSRQRSRGTSGGRMGTGLDMDEMHGGWGGGHGDEGVR
eukprot:CAMPEP_0169457492 /NCGR_PEP_ID=MMETSP1042-20121227/16909_1 /TAXON_ID=464988 /ORGANISM="Hemiselmis andersenii, Strain CCMP1180" /LENGTH=48 /DNA_ID= /DNA_START= /DNA_END= /DNA_ORIENTATION=